jgi:hypothetical protein
MAVCLLAEVAYESDEAVREHLPQLLHALLMMMDSAEPIVYQHAQQVWRERRLCLPVRQALLSWHVTE